MTSESLSTTGTELNVGTSRSLADTDATEMVDINVDKQTLLGGNDQFDKDSFNVESANSLRKSKKLIEHSLEDSAIENVDDYPDCLEIDPLNTSNFDAMFGIQEESTSHLPREESKLSICQFLPNLTALKFEDLTESCKSALKQFLLPLVENHLDGLCVISAYNHNVLDHSLRKLLVDICLNNEMNSVARKLDPSTLLYLSFAIEATFPKEHHSIYYSPQVYLGSRKKISPKGLLYQRYQYKLELFRRSQLLPRLKKNASAVTDT